MKNGMQDSLSPFSLNCGIPHSHSGVKMILIKSYNKSLSDIYEQTVISHQGAFQL